MRSTATRIVRFLRHWRLRPRVLSLLAIRIWLLEKFRISDTQRVLFWAGVVGVLGGLATIALRDAMELLHHLLTRQPGGLVESFARMPQWRRLVVPIVGGALAGGAIHFGRWLGESRNTTDYMEAVALGKGSLSFRRSVVKIVSAAFSVASGASIGREGPLVQLSALVASLVGKFRNWSAPRRRVIVACGAAAGIASAYNAPIAGALFVSEIMLRSISMETLGPLVFSSVIATQVVRHYRGEGPLYAIPAFSLATGWELVLYLALGVVCGLLAPFYLRFLRASESLFGRVRAPAFVRLALGGIVVGVIATHYPEVCGNGYSVVVSILNDAWVWQTLLVVLVLKVVATGATFGSGAVGGVFTPTLFTGAGIGYLFAATCGAFWPGPPLGPGAYALAGMGMFIAATTRAPLMAIIIIFEMTLDYHVIVPLMMGCVVAYYTASAIESESLYSHALARKAGVDVQYELATLLVCDLMKTDRIFVRLGSRFAEIARLFITNNIKYMYVLDDEDTFRGVVRLQDTKAYLSTPGLADVVIALDLMQEAFPRLAPDSTLSEALATFAAHDGERLPVLDADSQRLLGSISKADVLFALAHRASA